ncbi:MAG TPA: hypothetical protein VE733_00895 [Streptosporangiaceae bacterium]|jgi:hypothetical protein|nr:hypothetical protein [Streptosporangiaceae bacterium]
MTGDLLWPGYAAPADLAAIEAVPLEARGLPGSTYTLLAQAAARWPRRTAITVLPEAARWREPLRRADRRHYRRATGRDRGSPQRQPVAPAPRRAHAAVVRPDGTVLHAGRQLSALCTALPVFGTNPR